MGLINISLFAGGSTKTNKDETKKVRSSVLEWMKSISVKPKDVRGKEKAWNMTPVSQTLYNQDKQ